MAALSLSFPDAGGVAQIGTSIESGLATLTGALGALSGSGSGQSPLAALVATLGALKGETAIDTRALSADLPSALATIDAALAPSALDFIRTLEQDFAAARTMLESSAMAQAVADGQSLQQVALAAVADAFSAFDARRAELVARILPAEGLGELAEVAAQLARLASDYDAHRDELGPFVARYLVGQAPDLLAPALGVAGDALDVLEAFGSGRVGPALDAPAAALQGALNQLVTQLAAFDPATAAGYDALDAAIEATRTLLPPVVAALGTLYGGAQAAVDSHAWDTVFSGYAALLDAIPLEDVPVPADAVQALAAVLEGLLARVEAQMSPADLAAKIDALAAALHEVFAQSPLGQVRTAIGDFLEQIVAGIAAIPTDKLGDTVHQVLGNVGAQVEALGLAAAGDRIEQAFVAVETFVRENLDAALGEQVGGALRALADQVDALPIATLLDNVNQLIAQLSQMVDQLVATLQQAVDQLGAVAAQLDTLSFKPVGDAVVGEIDVLRGRLAAINPNALSDVEKVALQGALAIVRAIDLDGIVQEQVLRGFALARDQALAGLDQVAAVLDGVRERIEPYSPGRLVADLVAVLEEARATVARIDGRRVMEPLYREVDVLAAQLGSADPGTLLAPLAAPYQAVMAGVEALDPQVLVAPLNDIYARIDALIAKIDVVPVLEELDRREKALFAEVRGAILAGLDALALPAPLDTLFAAVRPVLEGLTEALFADPAAELTRVGLDLSTRFKPSDLFAPLDAAYDGFLGLLEGVPAADLEAAFEAVRVGLATALAALDPRQVTAALRGGRGQLAGLSPRVRLATALQLPSLQLRFEGRVAGVPVALAARAELSRTKLAALAAEAAAQLDPLVATHDALDAAFGRRVLALDASGAEAAYGRVAAQLRRLLPEFLFAPAPLARADILVGLGALRPSAQAASLDALFRRFQGRLTAMQQALDPAFAAFFNALREPIRMLSPLAIRDDVAAVYDALRAKVRVIDPEALAADLRAAVYEPVHAAVAAVDPAALGVRLDAAYQSALTAVTDNVRALLDIVAETLDEQLARLREAVEEIVLGIEGALTAAAAAFDGLLDQVETLVFVEILERLRRLVQTLGISFEREVDRVVGAFDRMLGAIPLAGGSASGSGVSL